MTTDSNPTTPSTLEPGTEVRVRPNVHRHGELGTVVRAPLADRGDRIPADCTIPVAFVHVSGGPLWYAPDELEAVR